jgi:5-methylcytosine-specific restriction endonuclease McrA
MSLNKAQREYRRYLRSPAWLHKKEQVLRRAGYLCESCGTNPARDVHHVTYKYGYWTPNWLLRAVCRECHEILTAIDNGELSAWDKDEAVAEMLEELPY